ncbi:MAG: type II toxin-antitoxin system Phd/YefM family antitoxin [Stellaceae bacterium]
MNDYKLTDAKERLGELIDRALGGEGVVITRDGRPVAELRPCRPLDQQPLALSAAALGVKVA